MTGNLYNQGFVGLRGADPLKQSRGISLRLPLMYGRMTSLSNVAWLPMKLSSRSTCEPRLFQSPPSARNAIRGDSFTRGFSGSGGIFNRRGVIPGKAADARTSSATDNWLELKVW